MKYWNLLLLMTLIMAVVACRKETITTDSDTISDPPVEIENTVLKGIVKGPNGPLSGVAIDVYEGEDKVGVITSDANGAFTTNGLLLKIGKNITFYAQKTNLNDVAKRVKADKPLVETVTINMSDMPNFFQTEPLANPGSNDLIVVSGYTTTPDNIPVRGFVSLAADLVDLPSGGFTANYGGITIADETGYYEMLLPKNYEIVLWSLQGSFSNSFYAYCQVPELSSTIGTAYNGSNWRVIGPFTEDTQLPVMNTGYLPENIGYLTLTAVKCNGQPVTNGVVTVEYERNAGFPGSFTIPSKPDGTFTFEYDLCTGSMNFIKVKVLDVDTNLSSTLQTFTNVVGDLSLGNVVACN
jgi:hypothetical protein